SPDSPHLRADHVSLVVQGNDQPGIVAAVTSALARIGANIVSLGQHTDDPFGGAFFQRTVFYLADFAAHRPAVEKVIDDSLAGYQLSWRLTDLSQPKRVAVLASKSDHCLLDILWRQRRGELPITIPMVISNHATMAED